MIVTVPSAQMPPLRLGVVVNDTGAPDDQMSLPVIDAAAAPGVAPGERHARLVAPDDRVDEDQRAHCRRCRRHPLIARTVGPRFAAAVELARAHVDPEIGVGVDQAELVNTDWQRLYGAWAAPDAFFLSPAFGPPLGFLAPLLLPGPLSPISGPSLARGMVGSILLFDDLQHEIRRPVGTITMRRHRSVSRIPRTGSP
jgi:hypothetical protein